MQQIQNCARLMILAIGKELSARIRDCSLLLLRTAAGPAASTSTSTSTSRCNSALSVPLLPLQPHPPPLPPLLLVLVPLPLPCPWPAPAPALVVVNGAFRAMCDFWEGLRELSCVPSIREATRLTVEAGCGRQCLPLFISQPVILSSSATYYSPQCAHSCRATSSIRFRPGPASAGGWSSPFLYQARPIDVVGITTVAPLALVYAPV